MGSVFAIACEDGSDGSEIWPTLPSGGLPACSYIGGDPAPPRPRLGWDQPHQHPARGPAAPDPRVPWLCHRRPNQPAHAGGAASRSASPCSPSATPSRTRSASHFLRGSSLLLCPTPEAGRDSLAPIDEGFREFKKLAESFGTS